MEIAYTLNSERWTGPYVVSLKKLNDKFKINKRNKLLVPSQGPRLQQYASRIRLPNFKGQS
jgi:hypothetical protein